MKLLACSDFQLGAGADYGAAPGSRLRDQSEALGRLAGIALEHEVDAVVFAGDAFQHRRPAIDELLVFRKWVRALGACDIPVFAIPGNHDVLGPGRATTLDLFVDDLDLRVRPGAWPTVREHGTLAALPWAHPATFRIERGDSPRRMAAALLDIAAGLRAECSSPAVLVTHWAVSGSALPSGLPASALREPVLPSADLLAQDWDAVIAGHVHRPQRIDHPEIGGTGIVVPGSPAVCDFGEAEHEHGAWLLDLSSGTLDFVPIAGRPFVTLDLEWRRGGTWPPQLPGSVEEAVVRVRLRLQEGDQPSLADLRRELLSAGAHKVWAIQPEYERAVRAEAQGLREDEGPLELFDRWLASQESTGEESARALREQAAAYLEEEL